VWRRVITVAVANAIEISKANPSPKGDISPEKEPDTMTAMPTTTAAIAAGHKRLWKHLRHQRSEVAAARTLPT
jgi:hypothetical protein